MDDQQRVTMEDLVRGVLDATRDTRVAGALRRDFLAPLVADASAAFVPTFLEVLGEAAAEAEEMPTESADDAVDWIAREHPRWMDRAAEAANRGIGDFVRAHRDEVLASMRRAGEGPADRDPRLAEVRRLIDEAAAGTGAALEVLPARASPDAVHEAVQPGVERLEQARELLADAELDDAIVGVAPDPDGKPRSVAPDVEDLVIRSWTVEADLFCRAAERVGPPLEGAEEATHEQHAFLLDAIVALQETIVLRLEPPTVLRLARLRQLKGDMGEARAICEKVLEMDPAEPIRSEAEALLAGISKASPLGGKDRRCFIATAAAGDAPEVEALRGFRDRVLMPRPAGRALVSAYYRASPPLARAIASRPWLRWAVRTALVRPAARLSRRIG